MTVAEISRDSDYDEESPLLAKPRRVPLPWSQLWIILVLQLAEPLTSQVISPFTPQLIREIGITQGDETKVGYYVGMMQSLFFLAEAVTVLHWSRVSDRIGRKPVILLGLFGISLSMFSFGLSRTFVGLVISRCLLGALNGNIGVIKSVMAELTHPSNISLAYSYMPLAWATGGTLGPMIGGSLSHPTERLPKLFGYSKFLKTYPYFLPCAVPASFALFAWFITFMYLKETVTSPQPISELLKKPKAKIALPEGGDSISANEEAEKPPPLRSLLTWGVLVPAANYASLSLVDMSFRAILPLFYSTPIALGGLGLDPPTIGKILSLYGILNGSCQIFFFARFHDRFGSKNTFTGGILAAFPCFAAFPLLSYLAQNGGLRGTVWLLVGLQTALSIGMNFSYGAVFIFIQSAAPNRRSLGAVNGIAQMTVSVMRAIGPAAANSLFSLSIDKQYLGGRLVYYILITMVGGATFVATLLPRHVRSK
ncbi:hypothetical protein HGRIS_010438 [Hohenbuehelia grisea]|uniref:Major facilitator superfamily (MFS) profile domain-containing protein n=1 Tax=Hohenbuehelia grisea TaxID=104357 RepID=A0ABR3IZ37_9AGAR